MGQTNKIIEVNGKRYDAVTGAVVRTTGSGHKSAASVHARVQHASPRSVDGFARVSRDHDPKPAVHHTALKPVPAATHKPHAAATHAAAHKPQRAVTLMRGAVKKPQVTHSAKSITSQTRTDIVAIKPPQPLTHKVSYNTVDLTRHHRAEQMLKSKAVSHFGAPVIAPRQVAAASAASVATVHQPVAAPSAAGALDFIATSHTKPTFHHSSLAKTHHTAAAQSADIFAQALAGATSHEQTFEEPRADRSSKASKRKRGLGLVFSSLAVLLLLGFIGYRNSSQLSLKVASYRSGVHATLPSYQPADFAFSHLNYAPGTVTASYTSATGNQAYNISQQASNWDSQALYSNVVASAKSDYKTYQRAGRTVYVLANNTATWVDSGILYTVNSNASLSSSQLLDLASSM